MSKNRRVLTINILLDVFRFDSVLHFEFNFESEPNFVTLYNLKTPIILLKNVYI